MPSKKASSPSNAPLYKGHVPLVVRDERIPLPKRETFSLALVREGRKDYVVLHWLAVALGQPIAALEHQVSEWASEQPDPAQVLRALWVRGFDAGPVPCLAYAQLDAVLALLAQSSALAARVLAVRVLEV